MSWKIREFDDEDFDLYSKRVKGFEKKHKTELSVLFSNLMKAFSLLNKNIKPEGKWIKGETLPLGLKEIKQTRKGLLECRLYVYFDYDVEEILLFGIGGKDTQQLDIEKIKNVLKKYLEKKEDSKDHEEKT